MAKDEGSVNAIFDEMAEKADTNEKVTVGMIVEAVGHRGYGPFLTVPALVELSPVGAVPGVPTLLALIIATFAGQVALGRRHLWLPGIFERRGVSADSLKSALQKLRSVANWLDRWFHKRLPRFVGPRATRIAAGIAVLLCLTVPPLELIPFASSAPMAAIAVIGLGMLVQDGALMLVAFAAAIVGLAAGLSMLGG